MRKTSVYLSDEEAGSLRRAASVSGRPQADLIREGVRLVVEAQTGGTRKFHSMGKGHGGGPFKHWTADELYQRSFRPR